jgi:hypothetical protein
MWPSGKYYNPCLVGCKINPLEIRIGWKLEQMKFEGLPFWDFWKWGQFLLKINILKNQGIFLKFKKKL